MSETIGRAYVQVEPSFDGVVPKIEKEFSGAGTSGGKSFGQGFGAVLGTVGKVAASAAAAGTAAVGGMVKSAVDSFSSYQQLVGGVETLFGNQYKTVEEYAKGEGLTLKQAQDTWGAYYNRQNYVLTRADMAYATAGMSANEYMETVTSFAASLNSSLGENAAYSGEYANQAVIDMSDNANKMGTSMESIQHAYQGFAKQNFTMLDNLKLGYGGTKTEMERLMRDAEQMSGMEIGTFDVNNFADVIDAIHIVQENLGITGTTAKEAGDTITGSMASVTAAWQNVLTAMGTGDSNAITRNIDALVASASTFAQNMLPTFQQSLQGVSQLISQLAPEIASVIPDLLKQVLPGLLSAGVDIVRTLGEGILKALPTLMPEVTKIVLELVHMLVEMLPELIKVGMEVILQLAIGIAEALPELIPAIVETVLTIAEYLIDNIDLLIDAAIQLIIGLAEGLIQALPILIEKAPTIIIKLVEAIIRNAPKIMQAALELILMLVKGIVDAFGKLIDVGKQIVDKVKSGFTQKLQDAKNWGRDMIQNFINGIMEKWNALKDSVSKVAGTVKDYLGFSEPDMGPLSNFHTYAPDMMELFAKGIEDNVSIVKDALNSATSDVMSSGLDVNAVSTIQAVATPTNAQASGDRLTRIETLLAEFLPNINQNIYLDTGALVGGTATMYNAALGRIAVRGSNR